MKLNTSGVITISYYNFGVAASSSGFWSVSPTNLSRAFSYAQIFDEFYFHQMKFTFFSGLSTAQEGRFAFSYASEYYTPVPSAGFFPGVMADVCSTVGNYYSDSSIVVPGRLSYLNRYLCSPSTGDDYDGRMIYQGVLNFVGSPLGNLATKDIGALVIEYDLEFYSPREVLHTVNKFGIVPGSVKSTRPLGDRESFTKKFLEESGSPVGPIDEPVISLKGKPDSSANVDTSGPPKGGPGRVSPESESFSPVVGPKKGPEGAFSEDIMTPEQLKLHFETLQNAMKRVQKSAD